MWYEPDSKLATMLEIIIQNYEDDREKYWSEDEQTIRLREFVDGVAESIVGSSDDLVQRLPDKLSEVGWPLIQTIIDQLELSGEVRAKTEIILAWRFATNTDEMAERCLQLVELLLQSPPSERVLRFLRRLGRCYVVGLFPESIMVCRGVLENAVDECIQRNSLPEGTMNQKLDTLRSKGYLSVKARSDARAVWQKGNKAIHNDPQAVGQALDTIRQVLGILRELQQSPSPSSQSA